MPPARKHNPARPELDSDGLYVLAWTQILCWLGQTVYDNEVVTTRHNGRQSNTWWNGVKNNTDSLLCPDCQCHVWGPQHPQLRVGRRPCKGPRVDTKLWRKFEWIILNCLQSCIRVRVDQNAQFEARKFLKSDPCRSPKILGQPPGRKKDLAEGLQSH